MAATITVRGAQKDGRVVLWEHDPAHPKGEIFVVGDGETYTVAPTRAVKRLIGAGRLVEVTPPKPAAKTKPTGDESPKS